MKIPATFLIISLLLFLVMIATKTPPTVPSLTITLPKNNEVLSVAYEHSSVTIATRTASDEVLLYTYNSDGKLDRYVTIKEVK